MSSNPSSSNRRVILHHCCTILKGRRMFYIRSKNSKNSHSSSHVNVQMGIHHIE